MVTELARVRSAGREGTPVLSVVTDGGSTQSGSLIDEMVREGARRMLAAALEADVNHYIAELAAETDDHGRRLVVRNGHHLPRTVVTAAGPVEVRAPRVNGRRVEGATGERKRSSSKILPPCRKSPKVSEVLPLLYLQGLSSGDFVPALEQFLGSGAGLSPATVTRLTRQWSDDHAAFQDRDLSQTDYVYLWADGVHPKVRLGQAHSCVLVLLGVRLDGTKELVALAERLRESTDSRADLLRDCRRRGMRDPELVVGDGTVGLWIALGEVFPAARHQRCRVHKARNVKNCLPKSAQPGAMKAIQEICNVEDRAHAEKAIEAFARTYGTAQGRREDHRRHRGTAGVLRLPGRTLDPPADHQSHRVHVLHRQTPHQGHPRRGQPCRGPRDGVQAHRVRPGPLARGHQRPPRSPGPRGCPV